MYPIFRGFCMINKHPYWVKYGASENGSVYDSRGGELTPMLHHTGYLVITVRKDGQQRQLRVHRFLWETLVGEIPKGKVINHKNGVKTDNRIDNLLDIISDGGIYLGSGL
jgi:hypothetical protein